MSDDERAQIASLINERLGIEGLATPDYKLLVAYGNLLEVCIWF